MASIARSHKYYLVPYYIFLCVYEYCTIFYPSYVSIDGSDESCHLDRRNVMLARRLYGDANAEAGVDVEKKCSVQMCMCSVLYRTCACVCVVVRPYINIGFDCGRIVLLGCIGVIIIINISLRFVAFHVFVEYAPSPE